MRGEVVVVPFPFSDQSGTKKRPALILIDLPGEDVVLACISSSGGNRYTVPVGNRDFLAGQIAHPSHIHPSKLFTMKRDLMLRTIGRLTDVKYREVVSRLNEFLQ